jgi:hypothetical protein
MWNDQLVEAKERGKKEKRTKSRTCIAKKTAGFETHIGFSLDSKIEKTIQGGCE